MPRIEHVNLTVSNPDRTARLMMELFGWHIRWRGATASGSGHVIHVGEENHYLALYAAEGALYGEEHFLKGRPLNHIGLEVADLDEVEARVIAAGLLPFAHGDYEPGRRFYFLDPDGIEYEVASYRGDL